MAQAPIAITYFGSGIWLYNRTTWGAIFLVTVPETIIKSACRGEGRKTSAPKRARSYRAMVVAIISMAQQAKPKVSGQTEFLRPQLYSSSKEVAKIPCLLNLVFKSWSIETSSRPRQHTFLAGPNQTLHQQEQENQHSQASRQGKAGEGRGKRQQKNGLHVED